MAKGVGSRVRCGLFVTEKAVVCDSVAVWHDSGEFCDSASNLCNKT